MKNRQGFWTRIMGFALLAFLAAAFSAACQGKKAGEATNAPGVEMVTLDGVKSVLGTANDYAPGVVDVTNGDGEVIIAYRYYDADLQNFETDFASELAPKIQAFYRKFKTVDRIRLQVTANAVSTPDLWKPFAEFSLDRKTVEEIHWTGFLARYLLDLVLQSKK
jgi:hypothetical protein